MPPSIDPQDVYAGSRAGQLSPVVAGFPERIYVPNSGSNTVDVIDREAIALAPEEWRVEKQCASAGVACQGTSVTDFRETSVMSSSR